MSEELIYAFTKDDIKDVINFCKNYHLEETKKGAGRTGSGPRGFVGTARIKKKIYTENDISDPNQEFRKVLFYIEFENFKFFTKSIQIKDHIEKLDFIKNKEKYGLYFQGGVCKIDENSHNYIINCSR